MNSNEKNGIEFIQRVVRSIDRQEQVKGTFMNLTKVYLYQARKCQHWHKIIKALSNVLPPLTLYLYFRIVVKTFPNLFQDSDCFLNCTVSIFWALNRLSNLGFVKYILVSSEIYYNFWI